MFSVFRGQLPTENNKASQVFNRAGVTYACVKVEFDRA